MILGKRVLAAQLFRRDVLIAPGDPFGGFSRQRSRRPPPAPLAPHDLLEHLEITSIQRRGKQLLVFAHARDTQHHAPLDPFRAMGIQLGMSGNVLFASPNSEPKAHTHARWTFAHGVLDFIDPRRFGSLRVFRSHAEVDTHLQDLGPDALTITPEQLAAGLRGSTRGIKAALLDQGVLAGVGNIYADEALFLAGISPKFRAGRLSAAAISTLAGAIRTVLGHAVGAGGSTLRDFVSPAGEAGRYQKEHLVYGRGGEPCLRCGKTLKSAVLAQRTTVWCPVCQNPRRSAGSEPR